MTNISDQWIKAVELYFVGLEKFDFDRWQTLDALESKFGSRITDAVLDDLYKKFPPKHRGPHPLATETTLFPPKYYEQDPNDLVFQVKDELETLYQHYKGKLRKILVLSDLHIPHQAPRALDIALETHHDADAVIINGDFLDIEGFSKYGKSHGRDFQEDMNVAQVTLGQISRRYPHVILISGNHELARVRNTVNRSLDASMRGYATRQLNPLAKLAEQYNNVTAVNNHYIQLGGCVFNHPNNYSRPFLSTITRQIDIFKASGVELLPDPQHFQAMVQGHTHDLGGGMINGILGLEQGCLCSRYMEYKHHNPSGRRWTHGYAVVYLDANDDVDLNETRNFIIKD